MHIPTYLEPIPVTLATRMLYLFQSIEPLDVTCCRVLYKALCCTKLIEAEHFTNRVIAELCVLKVVSDAK